MSTTAKIFNYILLHPGSLTATIARGCKLPLKRVQVALGDLQQMDLIEWNGPAYRPAFSVPVLLPISRLTSNGFKVKIQ